MKYLIATCIAVLFVLGLSSCGRTPTEDTTVRNIYETNVGLEDGRDVTCIIYAKGNKSGLSCDWDGSRADN